MNIELVGKDLHPSDMLKKRLETKLGKIESRLGEKLFVHVKLGREAQNQYSVNVHFQGARRQFNAHAVGTDLIKAADLAMAKIDRQVKKSQHRDEALRKPTESIRQQVEEEAPVA